MTDLYRLAFIDGAYYGISGTGIWFRIRPIKVVERADGNLGVIFDPCLTDPPLHELPCKQRAALLDFPAAYDPRFGAVAFYLERTGTTQLLERVLQSVTFDRG